MCQTVLKTFTANRMSTVGNGGWTPLNDNGSGLDLTGYSFHMWWGIPDPLEPAAIKFVQYNPAGGITFTSPSLFFNISEADLLAIPAGAGTIPFEILATNDGGVHTLKPFAGTMTVPSFLTLIY